MLRFASGNAYNWLEMNPRSIAAVRRTTVSTEEQATRKFLLWLLIVSILFLVAAYAYIHWSTSPRNVSDPVYYKGPIRNHKGDLATIDGRILEYAKPQKNGIPMPPVE